MRVGTAKESYAADEGLFKTDTQKVWFGLLLAGLVLFPLNGSNYWMFLAVLVMINVISTTGLNILTGYTGQVSLGHAAFMAVGAYTVAFFDGRFDTPVLLNLVLAGAVAAGIGYLVGLPSLRIKGLYLAIATLAAAVILGFVFLNWTPVTGGLRGLNVPTATIAGIELATPDRLYWLVMPITVIMVLAAKNLFRSRVGRAFIAIRDRDISAEIIGISLLKYKLMSFAISSFYAGVAGGLWAYLFRVVTPESFPALASIFFLAAVIVGGAGTIVGGIFGAVFMTLIPEFLKLSATALVPWFPDASIYLAPVRNIIFGLLIIGFLIFEPMGLAEMWRRTRRYFALWPFRT
ncbi:MAG: branched-chain amino acid ABC transporter permease [Phreatobacter sp.]|uniref:branched-chain amino acid ABC transporter permease n=1 Tax=Phreatobacter sp. TaxID=1966341 RepID=UPI002733F5EC|nr:branched-chain amino acid ABC transporter permease [Phreatobacter sp.]MDP2802748.1 branched-chain amino acid ABC transporter permease [Phreatobacter sp.]